MKVSRQLTYTVLKPFRFAGRNYEPGVEFNARRVDPSMGRLRRMVGEGMLGLPGESAPEPEADPELELETELEEEDLDDIESELDLDDDEDDD